MLRAMSQDNVSPLLHGKFHKSQDLLHRSLRITSPKFPATIPASSLRHVTANHLRVHHLTAGEGPVHLIRGFPTSLDLWSNVMPELAESHRAIAINLPGYSLREVRASASG